MTTATDWTTRALLSWMTERFTAADLDAPRVVAEMLLAHVLDCDRMRLYMEVDRPAAAPERERLRELVRRALAHEPVQYLVGRAGFYGMELHVNDTTLIPQPCTEDLVEMVLEWFRAEGAPAAPRIADIGTGSGNVAVALARHLPEARIIATDVGEDALALAKRNADAIGVSDRVELRVGDGLAALDGAPFDAIVSNPPYIPDHEWDGGMVQRAVREHVPERATRGGADGLDVIRPVVAGVAGHLAGGGMFAVEVASSHADAVRRLADEAGLTDARVVQDHEGHDRFVVAVR